MLLGKICQIWKKRVVLDKRFPFLLLLDVVASVHNAWKYDSHFFTIKNKRKKATQSPYIWSYSITLTANYIQASVVEKEKKRTL